MHPLVKAWPLVSVLLLAGPAAAQSTPDDDLASIRQQVLHASYRPAAAAVEAYLDRADLDAAHRNAGLEVAAIVRLALRDEAGATAALAELYARDPGHRLIDPDASPVVQSAFARARESAAGRLVALENATPARLPRRGAPTIEVRLGSGADAVHEVRISYRHAGESRWATLVASPEEGVARATVPLADAGDEETIEFRVEALAPSATVIGTLGTTAEPLACIVPAAAAARASEGGAVAGGAAGDAGATDGTGAGGSVAEEPWLWILVGVVVVGAGVGIGLGVGLSQPGPQDGSLGNVTLPLVTF